MKRPRPGDYGAFLVEFQTATLGDLLGRYVHLLRARSEGRRYGCAWPRSNYCMALERALTEKVKGDKA